MTWKNKNLIDTGDSDITIGYFVWVRYWAICLEIAISRPASSQISPSSSKSPHVINRVRKMHFNHWVVGMLRILTENSIVGTHATIPWLDKTAGGNESATSKIDNISKGRSFLNFIHPIISELSDNFPDTQPVQMGSNRISTWLKSVKLGSSGTGTHFSNTVTFYMFREWT